MDDAKDRKIDYGNLMHDALRGLIYKVLRDVQEHGLPGEHHFFITYDTRHPQVELADWLRERFPESMTIVLQHWFDALEVEHDGFRVTLNFGDNPERMFVPFDAIETFVDPSVEFGLRFEQQEHEAAPEHAEGQEARLERIDPERLAAEEHAAEAGDDASEGGTEAEIVNLDTFRK